MDFKRGYGSARLYEKLEQLKKPEVDKILLDIVM